MTSSGSPDSSMANRMWEVRCSEEVWIAVERSGCKDALRLSVTHRLP